MTLLLVTTNMALGYKGGYVSSYKRRIIGNRRWRENHVFQASNSGGDIGATNTKGRSTVPPLATVIEGFALSVKHVFSLRAYADASQKIMAVAKDYISIAYSPAENKGTESIRHLCTQDSWFWSPSTFAGCSTPIDYAESHAYVMASVNNLHIIRYDQAWANDGHVLLRYTAEGLHSGKSYHGIEKSDSSKEVQWSVAAIFEIENGKVKSFVKDCDQTVMQVSR